MNEKELATVLAALRHWQNVSMVKYKSIYFGDVEPMTDDEIDELCEKLNTDHDPMTERCCRNHELQANDGLEDCLCCGERIG